MGNVSNFDELYPGRFLKAGLFKGKKPTLTIKDVATEQMEDNTGKAKTKAILSFVERPMELVMCKTNGICIKAMFGKELKDWVGKRVTLFAGQWNGEECVRVWGSPDIPKDFSVEVELPRRKPFAMVMHRMAGEAPQSVTAQAGQTAIDPRVMAAWEILGWTPDKGELNRRGNSGMADSEYLSYLNALVDKEAVAGEPSFLAVP